VLSRILLDGALYDPLGHCKLAGFVCGRCQGKGFEHSSSPSAHDALRVWRYATGHTAADVAMEAFSRARERGCQVDGRIVKSFAHDAGRK